MALTRSARAIGIMVAALAAAGAPWACDTPVYQYSMYEWRPDRYEVRYFHRAGDLPAADSAANERLRRIGEVGSANLRFISVEVGPDAAVAHEHARAWQGHRLTDLPLHVVSAPGHGPVFSGRLDAEGVGALIDSPARRKLAGELSAGRAGVLLVLLDPAAGDSERVLKVARDAAAEFSDGGRALGLVSVDRADPAERWLVRQLLTVEDDLADLAGSMVFGVFGRAHVLPPFVGGGVTAQGMADLAAFIHGPCACELKSANPGLDLLVSWNWDERLPQWATASAVRPSFVLFDFTATPDGDAPGRAGAVDPDAPEPASAAAPERPLVGEARGRSAPRDVPEARSPQAAASPAAARVTAPGPAIVHAPEEETAADPPAPPTPPPSGPEAAPDQAAQSGGPAAGPAAAPDAGEAQSPPADPATGEVRLVARAPELPGGGRARLMSVQPPEEPSFAGVLALRLGLAALAIAVVVGAGHLVLRRSGGARAGMREAMSED